MDRYPVAGKVIGFDLWYGLSLRDLVEVGALPFVAIFIPRTLSRIPGVGINTTITTVFGLLGLVVGLIVLVVKDDAQRPLQYLSATLRYHLTTNTYYHRRHRTDDLGDVQEVFISQMDDEDNK